jgi:hypothetical protein
MVPEKIQPGIYRHFKGNFYEVIGVARKVDTAECFVIYRPLYGEMHLVARPFEEFTGTVPRDGGDEPRFRYVESPNGEYRCHAPGQGCGSV